MKRRLILAAGILSLGALTLCASAQTYTNPNGATFTNPNAWDFGAGTFGTWDIPASDAALTLNFLTFGSAAITGADDLNLTLGTLNLNTNATGALTLSSSLGGDFAFAGAAKFNLLGSGTATVISAPVVLGSGASSLTLDGAGASGVTFSGIIASSNATGAPLIIATDARNSGTGVVTLGAANTFAGGVVLNTGTLSLGNASALGDIANTLTINGGVLRASSSITVANNVTLGGTLNVNTAASFTLGGVLGGNSSVNVNASAAGAGLILTGGNTYTGATTVGASNFAQAAFDGAGLLRVSGAMGSIFATSGISVGSGAMLDLNYTSGSAAANTRVSTGTAINVQGGFIETRGNAGLITQSLGTVNAGGLTQIVAATTATATGTEVAVANLVRSGSGTVVFAGANLGGAAVGAVTSAAQGNIRLTQIGGAAPGAALIGGGGTAGSTSISILPWALGDTATTTQNYAGGGGFVTYGANGVRLLNTATEYNTSNSFTGLADNFQNMRVTASAAVAVPTTVNSLLFGSTGMTLSGAGALTITSGALASNVATATISNPVFFGAGGAGEAVISVTGALTTTNNLTLSGGFTAASLTKSGHGDLTLSTADPTISGGITINGGEIKADLTSRLGGATGITVNGSSQSANRAGLNFTYTSGTQTLAAPITVNAGTASISLAGGFFCS